MKPIILGAMVAFLVCSCASMTPAPKPDSRERVACDDNFKALLVKWSLPAPEGWKCWKIVKDPKASSDVPYHRFEKGEKFIIVGMLSINDIFFPQAKDEVAPDAQEPFKTIRFYTEEYLLDPKLLKPDGWVGGSAFWRYERPKAILFSPENERILFYEKNMSYLDDELEHREKPLILQYVDIFMAGNEKDVLRVGCHGCSVDEFFSLVVNPVIQR